MTTFTETQSLPSSSILEMQPFPQESRSKGKWQNKNEVRPEEETSDYGNLREDVVPPETAVEAKQTWNSSRSTIFRVFSCFFSFFVVGMKDGSYGVFRVPHGPLTQNY
jgi:hypothetical protein